MQVFERVWDLIEAVINPRHVILVLFTVSSLLVGSPYDLVKVLDIENFVSEYRHWIVITLLLSGGLILISCLHLIGISLLEWISKRLRRLRLLEIPLSVEGAIVLDLVRSHAPDGVPLLTNHPFVRELRLGKLITVYKSSPISNQMSMG